MNILRANHLSVMSAITLDGKLYMIEQERAFKGEDVVRFLKHLMRQIGGKLLVIWDGAAPIHHGRAVKEFLANGAAGRVQLEQLCRVTLRISTPTRGSGSTSNAWS
jgi:DDE superfamily endonuclease